MAAADEQLSPDDHLLHLYTSAGVQSALKKVHDAFPSVPLTHLFPAMSYTRERTRNKAVELMAMAPLLKAVEQARMRWATRSSQANTATTARPAANMQQQPDGDQMDTDDMYLMALPFADD